MPSMWCQQEEVVQLQPCSRSIIRHLLKLSPPFPPLFLILISHQVPFLKLLNLSLPPQTQFFLGFDLSEFDRGRCINSCICPICPQFLLVLVTIPAYLWGRVLYPVYRGGPGTVPWGVLVPNTPAHKEDVFHAEPIRARLWNLIWSFREEDGLFWFF